MTLVLPKLNRAILSEHGWMESGEQLADSGLSISESSQDTNAKVDTPITLRDERNKKDNMDSLIKTENCDIPDSSQFKNFSNAMGTIKNTYSTIPYLVLAGFIQPTPSRSYL